MPRKKTTARTSNTDSHAVKGFLYLRPPGLYTERLVLNRMRAVEVRRNHERHGVPLKPERYEGQGVARVLDIHGGRLADKTKKSVYIVGHEYGRLCNICRHDPPGVSRSSLDNYRQEEVDLTKYDLDAQDLHQEEVDLALLGLEEALALREEDQTAAQQQHLYWLDRRAKERASMSARVVDLHLSHRGDNISSRLYAERNMGIRND